MAEKYIRVQATRMGYIGTKRLREDAIFDCPESMFSDKWMIKLEKNKPSKEPVEEKKPQVVDMDSDVI